jgi:hypothetical protein
LNTLWMLIVFVFVGQLHIAYIENMCALRLWLTNETSISSSSNLKPTSLLHGQRRPKTFQATRIAAGGVSNGAPMASKYSSSRRNTSMLRPAFHQRNEPVVVSK